MTTGRGVIAIRWASVVLLILGLGSSAWLWWLLQPQQNAESRIQQGTLADAQQDVPSGSHAADDRLADGHLVGSHLASANLSLPLAPLSRSDPYHPERTRQRLSPAAQRHVDNLIAVYREQPRRGFVGALERSTRHLPHLRAIFAEAGLPLSLAWLPLIESSFVTHAVSPAAAVGLWQFMPATATQYALTRNRWWDMRRDPIHSARAAARLLSDLHRTLGDWDLTLAAYNAGLGRLRTAQRAHPQGRTASYWDLHLPRETRNYVPAFIAAVTLAENPARFGLRPLAFADPWRYELLTVGPGCSLPQLVAFTGVPRSVLRTLNPMWHDAMWESETWEGETWESETQHGSTQPGAQRGEALPACSLRVPLGTLPRLIASWAERSHVPVSWAPEETPAVPPQTRWHLHRLRPTDTLRELAKSYGVPWRRLASLNGLSLGHPHEKRQDGSSRRSDLLLIPLSGASDEPFPGVFAAAAYLDAERRSLSPAMPR